LEGKHLRLLAEPEVSEKSLTKKMEKRACFRNIFRFDDIDRI
jgi:hypothetical protein